MVAGPPLVIRSAGTLLDERAVVYPTVLVDASDRPDVADLTRVVSTEGVGDLSTFAEPLIGVDGRRLLRLDVRLTRPVAVAWSVEFHLPEYSDLLALAAERGCLVFAFGVDGSVGSGNGWLGVDLDPAAVRAILDFGR